MVNNQKVTDMTNSVNEEDLVQVDKETYNTIKSLALKNNFGRVEVSTLDSVYSTVRTTEHGSLIFQLEKHTTKYSVSKKLLRLSGLDQ